MFNSLDLNERPPKTAVTVKVWPLGRCTSAGAMVIVGKEGNSTQWDERECN